MQQNETLLSVNPQTSDPALRYLEAFWDSVGGDPGHLKRFSVSGTGTVQSIFPVTDFATAAVGAASLALVEYVSVTSGRVPALDVNRRLASLWFGISLRPQGWSVPPLWDAVAGDYLAADGWIRLHTNAPHHRDAALAVLGTAADKDAVARAVSQWKASELESAVVANRGCAAAMRTIEEWNAHPQGVAVGGEPLLHIAHGEHIANTASWHGTRERPLGGIRVVDLTRILAGPVATRFLAGYGAEVLRIDPPGWDEAATIPDVVLGKRCARLDLKTADGLATLEQLLRTADIVVHGYRSDALDRIGLTAQRRRELNPALIDISLDAYGWTGPWHARRGFDSLVQMSTGVADAGMRAANSDRPVPLPFQAIDHATGYLLAAAAIRGLTERLTTGRPSTARASLARTAKLLIDLAGPQNAAPRITAAESDDFAASPELTSWGPALRLKPPVSIAGTPMHWSIGSRKLGSDAAAWQTVSTS